MATTRTWRKSSYSSAQGNCVEVCLGDGGAVGIRDSKNVPGPELAVSANAWFAFVDAVEHGEFDL
jgi:hypothetical protein